MPENAARSDTAEAPDTAESGLHSAPTSASTSTPTSSRARRRSTEEIADYLVEVGTTLAAYGCPSYRLEDVVREIALVEGYHAEPFALPTGFFLSVSAESGSPPLQRMSRVEELGVDLGRLTAIDRVFNDVIERRCTIDEARTRLRTLAKTDKGYPQWLRWIAVTACSSAAAVFFQGGIVEVVAATLTGLAIFTFGRLVSKLPSGRFLVDFFGGFLAACAAGIASKVSPNIAHEVVVLAGVIALIPGMKFTTGLAELAKKSLVAGAARLMDAIITFLSISFGIALAIGLEKFAAVPAPLPAARAGLGLGAHAIALTASSLAFAVLFSVPRAFVVAKQPATGAARVHVRGLQRSGGDRAVRDGRVFRVGLEGTVGSCAENAVAARDRIADDLERARVGCLRLDERRAAVGDEAPELRGPEERLGAPDDRDVVLAGRKAGGDLVFPHRGRGLEENGCSPVDDDRELVLTAVLQPRDEAGPSETGVNGGAAVREGSLCRIRSIEAADEMHELLRRGAWLEPRRACDCRGAIGAARGGGALAGASRDEQERQENGAPHARKVTGGARKKQRDRTRARPTMGFLSARLYAAPGS
jgi:uncharacterized membrane protein YjjP (DUF1212 family)